MPIANASLTRRLIYIAGGLFVFVIVLHFVGVGLLRYFVERELHPELPKGTFIGEVHLNLFSGALEVEGFELKRDGETRLRAGRLLADVSTLRLLTGTVKVQRLELKNAYARVDRLPDGQFDLGLPDFGGDAETTEPTKEPLDLIIAGVVIDRFTLDYRDGDLKSVLRLDQANVSEYSLTSENQETRASWALSWDDQRIDGSVVLRVNDGQLGVEGELRTDPLDLDRAQLLARMEPEGTGEIAFSGEFGWQGDVVQLKGAIKSAELGYTIAGREVAITGLEAPSFAATATLDQHLSVQFTPVEKITAASWSWRAAEQTASSKEVVLEGAIEFVAGEQARVENFSYQAATLVWRAGAQTAELAGLVVSGQAEQSLADEAGLPSAALELSASQMQFADESQALAATIEAVAIEGLVLGERDADGARALAGQLKSGQAAATQGGQQAEWNNLTTAIQGKVSTNFLDVDVHSNIEKLLLAADALPNGPLSIAALEIDGLRVTGDASEVARVQAREIALPGGLPETRLGIKRVDISKVGFDAATGTTVNEIVVDGLQTAVIRDKAGIWQHVMTAEAVDRPGADPAGADEAAADGPAWRLGGLRVTGNSYVTIADNLNPDMKALNYQMENVRVGALDSAKPNADTPFELLLRPDRFAEFQISGVVKPLAEKLFLDAEGHLHGFGLTSVNGLVANDLGHRFLQGQIDNDFSIRIASDRLEMGNQLSLATLEVEEIPDKEGPPLGTAIALLEDRDGNINLEVPVSGDLTDPDFRVLGALNPIIMKAAAGAAALAIQPFGSVLLVGSLLADQALKVTFEPALFDAGDLQLNPAAQDYLDQLSEKLVEKPKLAVRICGIYGTVERERDKKGEFTDKPEDLLVLAHQRADAVREHMQKQGVGAKQLRTCRPAIDPDIDGLPRVDIRF